MSMVYDKAYFETQYRNYERQNPVRKIAFYRRLVVRAAGETMRPRILDIGCAFGHFLAALPAHWERCGIDASQYAVGHAARSMPEIQFAVGDWEQRPFGGHFDLITAFDVLEHVANLPDLLDWIMRSLRVGGSFVFVVPVYDGPTGPIIRFLDRDPTHVHKKVRRFWLECGGAGLQLSEWWGIFRYCLPGGHYIHAVTRLWREYCPAIACVLRRRE